MLHPGGSGHSTDSLPFRGTQKAPTPSHMVRGQSDKKIVSSMLRLQVADGADYFFMRVTYKRIMPPTT